MKQYDYLVVGAGLFGAVFAHEITKRGKSCLVIDKRDHIAGNIYTEKVDDINVHRYGAHIFHTSDRAIWDYINQFAEFNNYINSPIAVYHDETYNLPFNMNTFSRMWNIRTPKEAKAKIDEQRNAYIEEMKTKRKIPADQPFEPQNLEEQALSLAGRDVYEKLIKGYTEKQWGRPCTELPAFIIKRLPFRFVYDNNYFNDRYQGIPIGGYTQIVEKMLDGIDVRTGEDYFKVVGRAEPEPKAEASDFPEDEIIVNPHAGVLSDGTTFLFDKILFTGQIDQYYDYQFGSLEYRSVRFETEELDTDNYQGNAVVNYTAKEVPYTRIIEHKLFEFGKGDKTIISREYSSEWKPGVEPYYPVNNEKNNALYQQYADLAKREEDVLFGGRLGLYQYYDMDKDIAAALKLVNEI
ncbi:UDP-galactopyranose mutase [Lachnospiraceae bacterium YH-ros2228]